MNLTFEELKGKVEAWAEERGLIKNDLDAIKTQWIKFSEEFGELCGAILMNDTKGIIDGFGDSWVTLIILNKQASRTKKHAFGISKGFYSSDYPHKVKFETLLILTCQVGKISKLILKNDFANFDEQLYSVCSGLKSLEKLHHQNTDATLQYAWNEIKNRKGKTINNTFIKEN